MTDDCSFLEFHNLNISDFFYLLLNILQDIQCSGSMIPDNNKNKSRTIFDFGGFYFTMNSTDCPSVPVILFFQRNNNKIFLETQVFHYDSCKWEGAMWLRTISKSQIDFVEVMAV